AQNPGQPVDSVLDFIAGVIVRAGIDTRSAVDGVDGLLRLPVDGHHDGAIQTVLRPHSDLCVGAVGHDREIGWVVIPLIDQLYTADRQSGFDRYGFDDL